MQVRLMGLACGVWGLGLPLTYKACPAANIRFQDCRKVAWYVEECMLTKRNPKAP